MTSTSNPEVFTFILKIACSILLGHVLELQDKQLRNPEQSNFVIPAK